jgi:arabinofuranosyltransferase
MLKPDIEDHMFKLKYPLSRSEIIALTFLGGAATMGLYFGWRLFWFLTDDAFIAFRYVSNSILGFGYVWNPPPFRPVEGYTSFLWVAILDGIWRLTGILPTKISNWLSLGFSFLMLVIGIMMLLQFDWREPLRRYRILFVALVLAGVLTNRTFLTWTSSGLETAMFNFFLILWIYCVLFLPTCEPFWILAVSLTSGLVYLTRPEGFLAVMATVCLLLIAPFLKQADSRQKRTNWIFASPLLIVPMHLLWRKMTYGEWLPNTFYAKSVYGAIWFESGWRYALAFILEYALWIWLAASMVWMIYELINIRRHGFNKQKLPEAPAIPKIAVLGVLAAHFFYYTVIIGGDHFEFRVYSHLILLLFISIVWLFNHLPIRLWTSVGIMAIWIVFSWVIPWTHWSLTNSDVNPPPTFVPVRPAMEIRYPWIPNYALSYVGFYDELQAWLNDHYVCLPQHHHKWFTLYLLKLFPSRGDGEKLPGDGYPVMARQTVGVAGWVLPTINIIDVYGLNDYVVARNPLIRSADHMAHERQPPPGYLDCFSPNVKLRDRTVTIVPRTIPLTAEKIIWCEHAFADVVDGGLR